MNRLTKEYLETLPNIELPDHAKNIGNDVCDYEMEYWCFEAEHPVEYTEEVYDTIKLLWIAGKKELALSWLDDFHKRCDEDDYDGWRVESGEETE